MRRAVPVTPALATLLAVPALAPVGAGQPFRLTSMVQLQNASILEEVNEKQNEIGSVEIPNSVAAAPVVAMPRFTG